MGGLIQLGEITVGARRIGLYEGDLSSLSGDDAVDVLVVSAYPDDYTPTPHSLIGALDDRGVSVAELAASKALDMRESHACWLSSELPAGAGFRRLLGFEPHHRGSPPEVVDDIFESLNAVLLGAAGESTVAMPLVASGDMRWDAAEMFRPLLQAAVRWLRIGLPLRTLKIVERNPARAKRLAALLREFEAEGGPSASPAPAAPSPVTSRSDEAPPASSPPGDRAAEELVDPGHLLLDLDLDLDLDSHDGDDTLGTIDTASDAGSASGASGTSDAERSEEAADDGIYDVFISYAREDAAQVDAFVAELRAARPRLRIFVDRDILHAGADWIEELAHALDTCRRVVTMYSTHYFESKWCKQELHVAIIRERAGDGDLLFPVYLYSAQNIAKFYLTWTYADCREGDATRLRESGRELARLLS